MKKRTNVLTLMICFISTIFFSSCFSIAKLQHFTNQNVAAYNTKYTVDTKSVNFSQEEKMVTTTTNCTKNKNKVLPLIFVNYIDKQCNCTASSTHQVNIISNKLLHLLDSAKMLDKLKATNKRLEIKFTEVPNTFQYHDKETIFFYLVGYLKSGNEFLTQTNNKIIATATVYENEKIVSTNILQTDVENITINFNGLSYKRLLDEFMESKKQTIKNASRNLFTQIYTML